MNNVSLIGNLTKDPVIKVAGDAKVANFTLAVRRTADKADFINCVAWRKTADLMEAYVKKGQQIGVVGAIETRSYDGADGRKVYVTEVNVKDITLLSKKNQPEASTTVDNDGPYYNGHWDDVGEESEPLFTADDLPF